MNTWETTTRISLIGALSRENLGHEIVESKVSKPFLYGPFKAFC